MPCALLSAHKKRGLKARVPFSSFQFNPISEELSRNAIHHDILQLDIHMDQALAVHILYAQDRLVKKRQDIRIAVRTANLVPACSCDPSFAASAAVCLYTLLH